MKKKIYFNIVTIATLVAILVTAFLLVTFYNFHKKNEIRALKDYGDIMSDLLMPLNDMSIDTLEKNISPNIRLTIIDLDGVVRLDNMADSETMENHLNRPEVKDAIAYGEGEAIRKSSTLNEDTYYYARLLSDNFVLRISRHSSNIFSQFKDIFPVIFLMVFIILLLSFFTSSILTKKIIKPLEKVVKNIEAFKDLNTLDEVLIYDEIMPFIKTVETQKEEIRYNLESLEEKAALMEVVTSSMEEGLIFIDKNKKILSTNDSGIRLLQGDEKEAYFGDDFIKLSRNIKLYEALEQSIETTSSKELLIKLDDKYLNIYINPVLNHDKLIGLVVLVLDITKKHKLDLMRKEFSANVSHELKTPLTSINGYAEMIENGMAKEEDIKKFAATIKNEGSRLLNLIDDIIRLSEIEESDDKGRFESIDIYSIGKNTVDHLSFVANQRNINVTIHGKSTFIEGNKHMIQELMYNLLDNSIKYTLPGGQIDLSIESDNGYATIKVKDTGIGISKDHQSRIFERFYIVDTSRSKNVSSTGLGLSIVKHVVEHHQGEIELKSEIHKGTEITIRLRTKKQL